MCDICGENPQVMQIGNMETGEQKFVCTGCFARFGLDFARAVLPAEEIAQVLGPMFVQPSEADHRGLEDPPAPPARRKGRARATRAAAAPAEQIEEE